MKILLVQPPLVESIVGAGLLYLNEPLALETVAAGVLRHDVRILDLRLGLDLDAELARFRPDVVGITGYTPEVYTVRRLADRVKRFDGRITTVVGGHHATMFPEDFNRPTIDAIVIGEGQSAFRELAAALEEGSPLAAVPGLALQSGGRLVFTPGRDPEDPDAALLPARHLTAAHRQRYFRGRWRPVASLMTSRGCPHRCSFCSVWKREGGKYRRLSPERVVAEIESIAETHISVADDNFLQDYERAEEVWRLIKRRGIRKVFKLIGRTDTVVKRPDLIAKWKEIGLDQIFLGLESCRDEDFLRLGKTTSVGINNEAIRILHGYGISVVGQFIIHQDYGEEDFRALAGYVRTMRLSQPIFSVLTPLPGTELYEEKKSELLTRNYEMFDLVHSVLPTRLPREQFYRHYADLYAACYGGTRESSLPQQVLERVYSRLVEAYHLTEGEA